MENIRGLTADQERFFSREDSAKQLTPFSVFYSVLAAIMMAWLLISLITYIAVSIFLNRAIRNVVWKFKFIQDLAIDGLSMKIKLS